MNGAPVSWRSQRQTSISKSSTKAEYISASEAACELVWLNDLLLDAGLLQEEDPRPLRTSKLLVNNKGAVFLVKTEALTQRSRHIKIRYHMIRDWANKGEIDVQHISGTANRVDSLTKPLPADHYKQFHAAIGVQPPKNCRHYGTTTPTIHTA